MKFEIFAFIEFGGQFRVAAYLNENVFTPVKSERIYDFLGYGKGIDINGWSPTCVEATASTDKPSETLQIGNKVIMKGNEQVGMFKWFDGISTPCVLWQGEFHKNYSKHKAVNKDGTVVPVFKPSLCVHGTPALEVSGNWATPALHYFLRGMFTNWTEDERYSIHQAAGAFFQGGHNDPDGKWFLVEFWKPEGVEAFIQYVNEHYDPADESYKDFL